MAEYIEREAVYDIFTAKQQELLKFYRYYQLSGEEKEEFNRYDSYLNEIEAIPTADVVEVVRCKDCEKWDTSNKLLNTCACTRWSQSMPYPRLTSPDDFCSYGVKKEGAEE